MGETYDVVHEVGAHTGKMNKTVNAVFCELFFWSDARAHKNGWTAVGASADDDFFPRLIRDLFAGLGNGGDACRGELIVLLTQDDFVHGHFGFDGDVGLLLAFGNEVCGCASDTLVYCSRYITASVWCFASGKHVRMVWDPLVD